MFNEAFGYKKRRAMKKITEGGNNFITNHFTSLLDNLIKEKPEFFWEHNILAHRTDVNVSYTVVLTLQNHLLNEINKE